MDGCESWPHGQLIINLKDKKSFLLALHQTETNNNNPDLCILINSHDDFSFQVKRVVLHDFPHSQHRPIIISYESSIPIAKSFPLPRWNFEKANLTRYRDLLDEKIKDIQPITDSYDQFIDVVKSSAKTTIPRGYRKVYIPGWDLTCDSLYSAFKSNGNRMLGTMLLNRLNFNRREIRYKKLLTASFYISLFILLNEKIQVFNKLFITGASVVQW